ncbi:MAG TPA: carbamoyltransferase HypF [Anaerolineaceae bacterium]|nr:carbamoyltransferase HypF [Anaerolineaceae bacterium]
MPVINKRLHITGIVQGVGFRPTVFNLAQRHLLKGWVLNNAHGVEIELRGTEQNVQAFIQDLRQNPPPLSVIDSFTVEDASDQAFTEFQIRHSEDDPSDFLPVSPDLNICPDCRRELFDPSDRRYRYPFINCTNCGPRFSIVTGIPYDRPNTSMASFSLCPDCAEEYQDPANRRFHAQPIACPVCGPQVWYEESGQKLAERETALQAARKALAEGKILAVKGLGGFHLVCDAQNPQTVEKLRLRKRRSGKPFALMAFDVDTIKEFARVCPDEEKLLTSPMAPVVLLETTLAGKELARLVAPDQNRLGFMLPYTPLHLLLLEPAEGFPKVLVMTSGNLSEEPIAYSNADAHKRLSQLADGFLLHDRPIHTRIDDSVVSVIEGVPHIQRRARGFAPLPLQISSNAIPTLACGTELKNTFCLVRDRYAFVSHHIGDLENQETLTAFEDAVRHYEKIFRIKPQLLAADMHPDYLANRYARQRAAEENLLLVEVQHHHAHIVSCMADNGLKQHERVIGLAFDGTGFGTDGAIWGGEALLADWKGFQRLCHLEYMPLPGGEAAVRKPARMALSLILQAGIDPDCVPFPFHQALDPEERAAVANQVRTGFNTPKTSSAGRLFDGVAALIGLHQQISYEAQNAIALETIADPDEQSSYDFPLENGQILVSPVIQAIVEDIKQKVAPAVISARFHNGLSACVVNVSQQIRSQTGLRQVALSGGVWQNKTLIRHTITALGESGFDVFWPRKLPTNDGGVSFGQALVALAVSENLKE